MSVRRYFKETVSSAWLRVRYPPLLTASSAKTKEHWWDWKFIDPEKVKEKLLPSTESTWKWYRESFHWGCLEVQALFYLILFYCYRWQSPDHFIQESATYIFWGGEKSSRSLKEIRYKEAKKTSITQYNRYQACKSSFLIISCTTVKLSTFLGQIWYTGRVRMETRLRYSAWYSRDYTVNCTAQKMVSVMWLYLTFVMYWLIAESVHDPRKRDIRKKRQHSAVLEKDLIFWM